jgi:hypothetical protein
LLAAVAHQLGVAPTNPLRLKVYTLETKREPFTGNAVPSTAERKLEDGGLFMINRAGNPQWLLA